MPRKTPGNYVPLDVNYLRDGAIRRAGEAAELLFVRALAYSKGARTAGFVPDYDLDVIAVGMRSVPGRVQALVREELWTAVDGGWRIRSWGRWNGGADGHSDAGVKGNHVRWHVNEGVTDPSCELCSDSPGEPSPEPPGESPGESLGDPPGRSQGKGREGKKNMSGEPDEAPGFAEFYEAYPRHEARRKAEQAWRAALKRTDAETIMAGLARFQFSPDRQFVPLPASWLNADRWADAAPSNVRPLNTVVTANGGLTREQVDDILGPDNETLIPPAALDPAEDHGAYSTWMRQARADRLVARERKARAILEQRVPV